VTGRAQRLVGTAPSAPTGRVDFLARTDGVEDVHFQPVEARMIRGSIGWRV